MYEPWHYRYVGKDAAKIIWENNYTLEEFIEKKVHITATIGINNASGIEHDYYEGTINPGIKYEMQPSTTTNITNTSTFSGYYSIFLSDYSDNIQSEKIKEA